MILVSIEPKTGTIQRYLAVGKKVNKTHGASAGEPTNFTEKLVYNFRVNPDPAFATRRTINGEGPNSAA